MLPPRTMRRSWRPGRPAGPCPQLPQLDVPLHALLDHERAAIIKLTEEWGEIDHSHRKLAHRGSRLGVVHVSESTAGRVLTARASCCRLVSGANRVRPGRGRGRTGPSSSPA